jgi:hypothetical protein
MAIPEVLLSLLLLQGWEPVVEHIRIHSVGKAILVLVEKIAITTISDVDQKCEGCLCRDVSRWATTEVDNAIVKKAK